MEPFSILLGTISVITTIVTTFGGQIENIYNRSILFRRCKDVLRSYKRRLEDLAYQIEQWDRIWCRQAFDVESDDRATYKFLWGEAGYDRITDIAHDIEIGFKEIEAMFRFRHRSNTRFEWNGTDLPEEVRGNPGPQIQKWNKFLDSTYTPSAQLYEKFAFAIYKNTAFKTRLDQLETDVSDLTSTSTRYFYQRHDIDSINLPNRTNTSSSACISHVQQQNNGIGLFGQPVFAQRPADTESLSIAIADCQLHEESLERTIQALTGKENLVCTMYTETWEDFDYDYPVRAELIELIYPWDDRSSTRSLNDRNGLGVSFRPRSARLPFTSDNIEWQEMRDMMRDGPDPRTSTEPRDTFRHILQHYRFILSAAGVCRNTILLYGTEWTRDLCNCQLMRARPAHAPMREFIARWPTENDFSEGHEPSSTCQHIPEIGKYVTFVSLAVMLAEMAIVAPIEIEWLQDTQSDDSFNADVRFWLPRSVRRQIHLRNRLTASQLVTHLQQLKPRAKTLHVGLKYKKAVEECFAIRQRFIQRRSGVPTAGDMDRCIEDIVKPLEEHCALLEKEYKKLASQDYVKNAVQQEYL
ncbi:hypothetical protein BDV96DRAFT_628245 [Lophiotrema nucula]|uniref:Uncharacterized protein n=1 Tax=Lophiotrema nucula TaxID=690887 RepID=A0A6A5ZM89_9PLEO|nr:hypothetical protein BDV96DRAFT_628245 [Lophiotrema nucula]